MALENIIPAGHRIREKKTWIKLVLMLFAVLAFGITADVVADCVTIDDNSEDRIYHYWEFASDQFFIGITVLVFLMELILFIGYLAAYDFLVNIEIVNFWLIELSASSFWAVLLLIASSIFISEVNLIDHKLHNVPNIQGKCDFGPWRFAGVCGLFLSFTYGFKCHLLYKELKTSGFLDGGYIPIGGATLDVKSEDTTEQAGELTVSV